MSTAPYSNATPSNLAALSDIALAARLAELLDTAARAAKLPNSVGGDQLRATLAIVHDVQVEMKKRAASRPSYESPPPAVPIRLDTLSTAELAELSHRRNVAAGRIESERASGVRAAGGDDADIIAMERKFFNRGRK
jgi:hypothetical protein